MDLSPFIAWAVALLGLAAAAFYGADRGADHVTVGWGKAFVIAVVLGVLLTFVAAFLHGACIDTFKLCKQRGDGNMSYWFHSFFAIPVYGLAIGALSRR